MKYSKYSFDLSLICIGVALIAFNTTMQARIGERKDSIERRLFASGGIMYRDNATEENRREGMPYMKFLNYFPSSAEIRIYFKTEDGRRPSSRDLEKEQLLSGWDLHVIYVGGKSVLEVYKRNQGLSEYELNHLLMLNANGSFWKKVEQSDSGSNSKKVVRSEPSAMEFDMETNNKKIRAKRFGEDGLIIIDAQLDRTLAIQKEADLIGKAPLSVSGF